MNDEWGLMPLPLNRKLEFGGQHKSYGALLCANLSRQSSGCFFSAWR